MRLLQDIAQPFAPGILPFTAKATHLPEIASKLRLFRSYSNLHEMQGLGKPWGRHLIDLDAIPGYTLSATDSVVYVLGR
jgi:hypothetical protein